MSGERQRFDYPESVKGPAMRLPLGVVSTPKVSAARTGGAYSLFELTVEPGGGQPPHIQHREDECIYVLSGGFEMRVEAESTPVAGGATVYVAKGTLHGFENSGESAGRLLTIHTPGGSHESFVEEISAANASAGLRTEESDRIAAKYGIEICRAS